jgi:glycosidase
MSGNDWIVVMFTFFLYFQPEDCKLNGNLNINNRKLPNFVNWNWSVIRKVLLWVVISGLVACLASIIAMVATIPKHCNPNLPWYQGKIFYEVFPASFKDSNNDGMGDLKGLIKKLDYIENLGVSAVRLNYIFKADNYPVQYYNVTSLFQVARSIGILKDFEDLVAAVHARNMSLILDLPVSSLANSYSYTNSTLQNLLSVNSMVNNYDTTSIALAFWAHKQKVDGFYLKNLENFVDHIDFGRSLQFWKHVVGSNRIFIASKDAYEKAHGESQSVLLSRIDLIDVHLHMNDGISGLRKQIDDVVTSTLWSKPYYPWVHWNIGNIGSERISSKHNNNTLTLTALQFVLPGTVSIFYGDEIGLGGLSDDGIEIDFHEHKDIHNLVPMSFANNDNENKIILPWNSKSTLTPKYNYLETIKTLTYIRLNTPTIYLRAIYKDGNVQKNIEIRKTEENLVVIERWYPRRNTCVFIGNLGSNSITTDLSSMFYGGSVIAGTNTSLVGQVLYLDEVTFPPNSAVILKLEK